MCGQQSEPAISSCGLRMLTAAAAGQFEDELLDQAQALHFAKPILFTHPAHATLLFQPLHFAKPMLFTLPTLRSWSSPSFGPAHVLFALTMFPNPAHTLSHSGGSVGVAGSEPGRGAARTGDGGVAGGRRAAGIPSLPLSLSPPPSFSLSLPHPTLPAQLKAWPCRRTWPNPSLWPFHWTWPNPCTLPSD